MGATVLPFDKNVEDCTSRVLDADVKDVVRGAVGASRVQVRMELDTLRQVDRDLTLLATATAESSRLVRQALRRGDTAVLASVRALMEQVNQRMNARRQGQ